MTDQDVPATRRAGRARELDSLRGLAALSVLGYHAFADNSPVLQAGVGLADVHGRLAQLLVYTPLHVVWLGAESVWLFFVLSGFVLTRSAAAATFNWSAYYPSRLVRLYLPVVAAVAVTWLLYLVPHPVARQGQLSLPRDYPGAFLLHDLTVVGGTSPSLGVLWSLQWEIVFSLLLPVFVLLARSRPLLGTIACTVVLVAGWHWGDGATSYLPIFYVGSMLAMHWERIAERMSFLGRRGGARHVVGALLLVAALLALTSYFLVGRQVGVVAGFGPRELSVPVVIAGVTLLVVLVQTWSPLRALLRTRPFTFLGDISFSLYLVHLPLVGLAIFAFTPGRNAAIAGIVVSLVAAYVFFRCVERPAHQLARRVRTRIASAGSTTGSPAPAGAGSAAVAEPRPEGEELPAGVR